MQALETLKEELEAIKAEVFTVEVVDCDELRRQIEVEDDDWLG